MQEIALVARLPVLLVLGLLLGAASSMLLPEDMAPYVVEFCIGSLVVAALLWTAYSVVKWVTANNRVETPLDLLSYHIGGALQPVIVLGVSALLMGATFLVSGLVGWASAFLEAGWFSLWVALESTAKIVEGVRFIPVLASSLLAFLLTGCLVWLIVLCSTRVELPEIAQILGKDIKEPGPSFLYPAIGLTMFGIWVMYNQDWGGMMLFMRQIIPEVAVTPVGMTVLVAVIFFAFPTFRSRNRPIIVYVVCGCILFLGMSAMAEVEQYIRQVPVVGGGINILLGQVFGSIQRLIRWVLGVSLAFVRPSLVYIGAMIYLVLSYIMLLSKKGHGAGKIMVTLAILMGCSLGFVYLESYSAARSVDGLMAASAVVRTGTQNNLAAVSKDLTSLASGYTAADRDGNPIALCIAQVREDHLNPDNNGNCIGLADTEKQARFREQAGFPMPNIRAGAKLMSILLTLFFVMVDTITQMSLILEMFVLKALQKHCSQRATEAALDPRADYVEQTFQMLPSVLWRGISVALTVYNVLSSALADFVNGRGIETVTPQELMGFFLEPRFWYHTLIWTTGLLAQLILLVILANAVAFAEKLQVRR